MQLAEIHENIQRMRMENAQSARMGGSGGGGGGTLAAGSAAAAATANNSAGRVARVNSRLSTSCPSLNEEGGGLAGLSSGVDPNHVNNNHPERNGNIDVVSSPPVYNNSTPTSSASNTGRPIRFVNQT